MRNFVFLLFVLIAVPCVASAEVNVFACEPEWGALAKEIGDTKVSVEVATNAQQDPHHIRAKPSLLAAMRKADFVICSGAGLEVGWLPVLLQKSGSPQVQLGQRGNLMASDYVTRLEVPMTVDRSEGDIHPEGNPHVHLNPHNIGLVAAELVKRLGVVDSANAAFYQSRYRDFSKQWDAATKRWEKNAAGLRGARFITHHKSLTYLLNWLGMVEAGTLEAKPGIPPTTSHLEALLAQQRSNPAKAILRTPYESEDASQWLSEKTGVPAVVLPYTIGSDNHSSDLFAFFDRTVALLTETSRGAH
jgi:zinc/manganese transport system substrate-binding protein